MLKISLDLDDTVNLWMQPYLDKFGVPKTDQEITKNVRYKLLKDKDFWLNLPIKNIPNFIPVQYTTARLVNKSITREYLRRNNLPESPIYQVLGYGLSKAKMLKGRVDVHIDDSLKVFIDLNTKGIPCLLMDSPYNQEWGPIGRVYTLNLEEIEEVYSLFINTVFKDFKNLL